MTVQNWRTATKTGSFEPSVSDLIAASRTGKTPRGNAGSPMLAMVRLMVPKRKCAGMNRYEADTTQFRALVAKGHPKLAVFHLLIQSRGVQGLIAGGMGSACVVPFVLSYFHR